MGRGGLVAYVEAQIERDIALGRLHPSGQFGPEAKLAQRYRVSRGTIREALRRLAARGLVVQHPGRRTRAVALDESLTLENLGLALHDASNPDARWLLEGYFSLKRQVLVELLVDCCEKASDLDLDRLGSACFRLQDAARWESGEACAQAEFELLRQAARAAARPGHVLLVQSLQRAFLGGAAQLLPLLGGEALREWANCAMGALSERNVQELQHKLPALLKTCDKRLLEAFAPAPQEPATPEPHCTQEDLLGTPAPASGPEDALAARSCIEDRGASAFTSTTTQGEAQGACPCVEGDGTNSGANHGSGTPAPINEPGCLAPIAEDTKPLGIAPGLDAQASRVDLGSKQLLSSDAPGLAPCGTGGELAGRDEMGAAWENRPDSQTGWGASPPEEAFIGPRFHPRTFAASSVERFAMWARRFIEPWASLIRWPVSVWRSIAHSPGPPAS
ncbi:GntR family transcriptional regulator [Corallococcus sp. NCSPR001]|nr:GntR family transcriptional regulator [Corallococcus sp. NCSPR001]MBN9683958.1 GntR family transcriptional regulator [Corallococcus sp. NCSPR001]WAS89489.1 GntR family transcriptional regulator [Corallococcus sp. NCRR]